MYTPIHPPYKLWIFVISYMKDEPPYKVEKCNNPSNELMKASKQLGINEKL